MKTTIQIFSILGFLIIGLVTPANAQKNLETIEVLTSSQCEMCKETIEKALIFESGIKKANLNVATKTVTVTFKANKITAEKIRQLISKAGYDADTVKADPQAYERLHSCCKKPEDQ